MVWLKFLLCLAIILFSGTKLARYADAIGEKTGLGRIWIGLMLLAVVTSMPELVTSISSVALVGIPDLAFGTIFGSCLFNLFIIGLLDILHHATPVLSRASSRHMAWVGLEILLVAVAAGGILAGERFSRLTLGWVGIISILIPVLYLVGGRAILSFERQHQSPPAPALPRQYDSIPARTVWLKFTLAAMAVIGAGIWLAFIGDDIAETTGWGASFVGSLFLAVTTSMPELVVAISALRLGAIDMALADILGANMLDIVIITWTDLFYTKGSIFSAVENAHLTTAVVVIVMSLLVLAGLRYRHRRKTFIVISWYALALIGLYLFGAYALFTSGTGLK